MCSLSEGRRVGEKVFLSAPLTFCANSQKRVQECREAPAAPPDTDEGGHAKHRTAGFSGGLIDIHLAAV